MSPAESLYSLVLRAYPRSFRRDHQEEMLTTLAETRAAGEHQHHVRQVASLLRGAGRQRWLFSTNGELGSTVRQGLAWGVLVLVGRQAGLALSEVIPRFGRHWVAPLSFANLMLALGWILAFCLLAAGRRRWGLIALTLILGGWVFHSVQLAISYGGKFSWPFTLHFFLPTALPLLAAYAWPSGRVKLPALSWAPIIALTAAILPRWLGVAMVVGIAICAVAVALALSLTDPRWAVAAALVVSVFGGQRAINLVGGDLIDSGLGILVLWILIPGVAVMVARRARRFALK